MANGSDAAEEWQGHVRLLPADPVRKPDEGIYSMMKNPRGAALIVCVSKFTNDRISDRVGSELDVQLMDRLLRELYFDMQEPLVDPTCKEMFEGISEFSRMCSQKGLSQRDECMALVLMSHGNSQDEIYASDGKTIPIKTITSLFTASKCRGLAGKPKLFIIQACRGEKKDTGCDVADAAALIPLANIFPTPDEPPVGYDSSNTLKHRVADVADSAQDPSSRKVPDPSDIYIAYSTAEEYVSWRNVVKGSWFIQDVVTAFSEKAHNAEIDAIFRRINQLVQTRRSSDGSQLQTSSIKHQLRKSLYFNPYYPKREPTCRKEDLPLPNTSDPTPKAAVSLKFPKLPVFRKRSGPLYKDSKIDVIMQDEGMKPYGVCIHPCGDLIVTDMWANSIHVISKRGEKKEHVGKESSGEVPWNAKLDGPCDVVINKNKEVLVADWGNKRIVKFSSETGKYLGDVKVDGHPRGICVDSDVYYVSTWDPDQVIKYNKYWMKVKDVQRQEFVHLHHLVHHQGFLYVADWDAHVLHVLNTDLKYVKNIGEGNLVGPAGVTVDSKNQLLVTEKTGITVLTLKGDLVEKVAEGKVGGRGIAADPSARKVIVADWGNHRLIRL